MGGGRREGAAVVSLSLTSEPRHALSFASAPLDCTQTLTGQLSACFEEREKRQSKTPPSKKKKRR